MESTFWTFFQELIARKGGEPEGHTSTGAHPPGMVVEKVSTAAFMPLVDGAEELGRRTAMTALCLIFNKEKRQVGKRQLS